ncbi:hypothetical protein O5D80_002902 [Batrachochytrium dendrobatidis]|nr:hypothetical protein O5D80_002902 [Batrachochytrium dendrobatidis]
MNISLLEHLPTSAELPPDHEPNPNYTKLANEHYKRAARVAFISHKNPSFSTSHQLETSSFPGPKPGPESEPVHTHPHRSIVSMVLGGGDDATHTKTHLEKEIHARYHRAQNIAKQNTQSCLNQDNKVQDKTNLRGWKSYHDVSTQGKHTKGFRVTAAALGIGSTPNGEHAGEGTDIKQQLSTKWDRAAASKKNYDQATTSTESMPSSPHCHASILQKLFADRAPSRYSRSIMAAALGTSGQQTDRSAYKKANSRWRRAKGISETQMYITSAAENDQKATSVSVTSLSGNQDHWDQYSSTVQDGKAFGSGSSENEGIISKIKKSISFSAETSGKAQSSVTTHAQDKNNDRSHHTSTEDMPIESDPSKQAPVFCSKTAAKRQVRREITKSLL